jgi:hypothetical protein
MQEGARVPASARGDDLEQRMPTAMADYIWLAHAHTPLLFPRGALVLHPAAQAYAHATAALMVAAKAAAPVLGVVTLLCSSRAPDVGAIQGGNERRARGSVGGHHRRACRWPWRTLRYVTPSSKERRTAG